MAQPVPLGTYSKGPIRHMDPVNNVDPPPAPNAAYILGTTEPVSSCHTQQPFNMGGLTYS